MITIKSVKAERTKLRRNITALSKWLDTPPEDEPKHKIAVMRQQLSRMQDLEHTLSLRIKAESNGDS